MKNEVIPFLIQLQWELNIKYPTEFLGHHRHSIWGHDGYIGGEYIAFIICIVIIPNPEKWRLKGAASPVLAGADLSWTRTVQEKEMREMGVGRGENMPTGHQNHSICCAQGTPTPGTRVNPCSTNGREPLFRAEPICQFLSLSFFFFATLHSM